MKRRRAKPSKAALNPFPEVDPTPGTLLETVGSLGGEQRAGLGLVAGGQAGLCAGGGVLAVEPALPAEETMRIRFGDKGPEGRQKAASERPGSAASLGLPRFPPATRGSRLELLSAAPPAAHPFAAPAAIPRANRRLETGSTFAAAPGRTHPVSGGAR